MDLVYIHGTCPGSGMVIQHLIVKIDTIQPAQDGTCAYSLVAACPTMAAVKAAARLLQIDLKGLYGRTDLF